MLLAGKTVLALLHHPDQHAMALAEPSLVQAAAKDKFR